MSMTKAEYDAQRGAINKDWPVADYPGMNSALVADLDTQYRAANAPPAQKSPATPHAKKAPEPVPALTRSQEAAARGQRIADDTATDADIPFMSAAQLREHIALNHSGAMSSNHVTDAEAQDERSREELIADLTAQKPGQQAYVRVDADAGIARAAALREEAAWADRVSTRAADIRAQGVPEAVAQGIATQQVAAERIATEGAKGPSGVQQAEAAFRPQSRWSRWGRPALARLGVHM